MFIRAKLASISASFSTSILYMLGFALEEYKKVSMNKYL